MGWIIVLVVTAIGILYIYFTVKVDKLDSEARDRASEIDGSLWDRAFQLSKLVEALDKHEIEHGIEALDVNTFGLGMSALMQSTNCEKLDQRDETLREVFKAHPELKKDDDFLDHMNKFDLARNELIKYSLAYNKSANTYNNYIGRFPASIIAMFHKKKDKAIFIYYFKELQK